jgi:hypothetical protein
VAHWATQIRSAEKQLKAMEAEADSLVGKS